ncbi:LysR family transcriptional regulator [Xanthomonas vasicola]|uniref:LysR family transcriptional regulator n=1 Tax=Xanthomonas vasicola pv. vasculorum NCPPB 890 TaxID=1184265 RepID=A0A836P4J9_XANVA|nr:LysR family transcriptional regulator [Xanthomonas vasicola]KFA30956.1 LysR family transcriptional regulator [Xanthomonas vasicola pv. musacearum NCPPB 4384]AZR32058.1 LysR family transcriptional regulator [Xanthomonas vasicola pv. musacearum NCPPB 4379]AZR36533.1 LysR family transcriptional regulator [Xanthomonas vasicola]KFA07088.1 LysR family transcriptional regulator [Xanthomonas vasicola pv. musacearum NCPPB 4380]KFA12658.1 LysR family transcriptional regulator [Xanthomonas vasicola pv
MADTISWELYRSFLAVLEEGSLSAAARALGLTQPTVGRHVAALEELLAVPLFVRSQTGLLPTDAAQALRLHARAMADMAAALQRAAGRHGDALQGTVRISASEVVGAEILPPILAALRNAHAQLRMELVLSNRVQDLLHREADVAVRMIRPQQDLLVARRVGEIAIGLHAHPDYVDRHGVPQRPDDLAQHALVGFDTDTPFLRSARKGFPFWEHAAFALRADSDLAQLALIRAGCGIGFCQAALARRTPRLLPVLPQQVGVALDVWVTMHQDLRASAACSAVFAALAAGLAAHCAAPEAGAGSN